MTIAPIPTIPIPPNPSPNGYINLPITVDATQLLAQAIRDVQAQIPGWLPMEGHLETIVLEEAAQMMTVIAGIASEVPMSIFMAFGQLAGIMPLYGVKATAPVQFTLIDTQGYTIPAGTQILFPISGNQTILFVTETTLVIPPGQNTGVTTIQCTEAGSFPNGLAAGQTLLMNQMFAPVLEIVNLQAVSGGIDPDTVTTYINRLADELALMAPRPIVPNDFAVMAKNVEGVYRACAIDGLSPARTVTDGITTAGSVVIGSATADFDPVADKNRPVSATTIPQGATIASVQSETQATLDSLHPASATGTALTMTLGDLTGQERCVTVSGLDAFGVPLLPQYNAAMLAYLNSKREVNFTVFSIQPTISIIDVSVTCLAVPGLSVTALENQIVAAINNYLNPATWGGGQFQPPEWNPTPTVPLLGLADAILTVGGVSYIAMGNLQQCLHGGTLAASDITLPGDAPLPQAVGGNITVVVNQ